MLDKQAPVETRQNYCAGGRGTVLSDEVRRPWLKHAH
jgi:hypothetical protein